jgi:hypothetical protein
MGNNDKTRRQDNTSREKTTNEIKTTTTYVVANGDSGRASGRVGRRVCGRNHLAGRERDRVLRPKTTSGVILVGAPQLSVAVAEATGMVILPPSPLAMTSMDAGQVMTGSVVSVTMVTGEHVATLLKALVKVVVMVNRSGEAKAKDAGVMSWRRPPHNCPLPCRRRRRSYQCRRRPRRPSGRDRL